MPTIKVLLAALLTALAGAVQALTPVSVDAAWARPTVQGQAGGGGFLRITGGDEADRLLSASAPISRSVELHTMFLDGAVLRMRQLEGIDIPAGQTVELRPGGLHVMFVGLTRPLQTGATFPLTLRFAKAGEQQVDVKVMLQPQAHEHEAHKP
jgi:copper(I)-binding protein